MRVVIYDDETFEPITVVNLRGVGEKDILQRGNIWRLPVQEPFSFTPDNRPPDATTAKLKVVEIKFETWLRRGQRTMMAFTKTAELAMLLEPAWLPGQQNHINTINNRTELLARMLFSRMMEQ